MNCPHCGGILSSHDRQCSYCGTENLSYLPLDNEVNHLLEEGMQAYHAGRYADAISYLSRATTLDPDVFDTYFYLAAAYTSLKRYHEAIEAMDAARKLRPGSAPAYYNLGTLHQQIGDLEKARTYYEEALQRSQTDPLLDSSRQFRRIVKKAIAQCKRRR